MQKIIYIFLFLIVALAAFLRFYDLDQIPPSLNWDEAAAGYNAYTIANWGKDEYGNKFPIVFKSFADDKHPVHIYITSIIIKIFGFSDFSVRASGALVGTLSVIAIFFLARELFKSNFSALMAALFLTVSPYHIHFSRGLWENNFAFFFLVIGLGSFYLGLKKSNYLLPSAFLFFGLSFFSYHSAKIVVPLIVLLVSLINIKQLFKNKKMFLISILITALFVFLMVKDTRILGFARIEQTKFSEDQINRSGGMFNLIYGNYKKHFDYSYLFEKGDQGPRASVKIIGQFYKIDFILSAVGLIALIFKKRWQSLFIILVWLLLSPLPSAFSSVEPSAIRGIFIIAPVLMLSAFGAYVLIILTGNRFLQVVAFLILTFFLFKETNNYLKYYFNSYSIKEAIEWQYGMKEIVKFAQNNDKKIYKMYIDNVRQQPYIFFLYYGKISLPQFLANVKYDQSSSKSFNTVFSFDKYQFGGWNITESYPLEEIYYVVTPSYYSGLKHIQLFDVVKQIKNLDKSDAFYIVTGHN